VLERVALIACVLAAALAAGCGGDDGGATSTSSDSGPLVGSSFKNVFVALPLEILKRGDNEELLRTKLQRDFQTSDFPLSPELFVERDGELVLFE
jgi:hypothetical protein